MRRFEKIFNYENIHIATDLDKDLYTADEVLNLLRAICSALDYKLIDLEVGKNTEKELQELREKGETVSIKKHLEDCKNEKK